MTQQRWFRVGTLLALLAVTLVGCGSSPATPTNTVTGPAQTTTEFYTWYLTTDRDSGSPMVSQAYYNRPELAPAMVATADASLAAYKQDGFDPFLCSKEVPDGMSAGQPQISGSRATVPVILVWNPGTSSEAKTTLTAHLVRTDVIWQITAIDCPTSPGTATK